MNSNYPRVQFKFVTKRREVTLELPNVACHYNRHITYLPAVLEQVRSGRIFTISSNNDENMDPENAMDNDQKTYVHSAEVQHDDFQPNPTLNITLE